MYKIEIWKYQNLEEVYEAEDIQDILAWYKWYWHNAYEMGNCAFSVYKNGVECPTEELWELGFYK